MAKPGLIINLKELEGDVYALTGCICLVLIGMMLEHFLSEVRVAMSETAGADYEDILAIIDKYVDLTDSSGLYPHYAAKSNG